MSNLSLLSKAFTLRPRPWYACFGEQRMEGPNELSSPQLPVSLWQNSCEVRFTSISSGTADKNVPSVFVLLHYAYALPDFRESHLVRAGRLFVVSAFFLGIIWARTLKIVAILAAFGMAADLFGRLSIGIVVTMERRKATRTRRTETADQAVKDKGRARYS